MRIEGLFDRIRQEEIALVIGSGISINAGYPSANELKSILIDQLIKFGSPESSAYYQSCTLEAAAEEHIRVFGRNQLNRILLEQFRKSPLDTTTHDKISRIPHFKEIITTNYDKLLDDAFAHRANVVRQDKDLAYGINKNSPTIYKIHGDIESLDNIIISRDDYARSIYRQSESLIWNKIKTIAASYDILFIGYSYEDPNIWQIFEQLKKVQGAHIRQRFIVAPCFRDEQKSRLASEGFYYFDMKGQDFIDQLITNIKESIIGDLQQNRVSHDTFNKFLTYHEKKSIIKTSADKTTVEDILNNNDICDKKITFTVPEDVAKTILDFSAGKLEKKELSFSGITSFSLYSSGFKFPTSEKDISQITIQTLPEKVTIFLETTEGKSLIEETVGSFYRFASKVAIEIELQCYTLILHLKYPMSKNFTGDVRYNFKTNLPNVSKAIQELEALDTIINKKKEFKLFISDLQPIKASLNKNKEIDTGLRKIYKHMLHLQTLERYFGIRFRNISEKKLTENYYEHCYFLHELLSKGQVEKKKDFLKVRMKSSFNPTLFSEQLDVKFQKGSSIIATEDHLIRNIYDQTINFGHLLLEIIDPHRETINQEIVVSSKVGRIIYRLIREDDFKKIHSNISS